MKRFSDRVPLEHFDAHQFIKSLPKHRAIYDISKRIFDIILPSVGTIVAIPFIAGAAVVLFLESGVPLSIRNVSGGARHSSSKTSHNAFQR